MARGINERNGRKREGKVPPIIIKSNVFAIIPPGQYTSKHFRYKNSKCEYEFGNHSTIEVWCLATPIYTYKPR